MTLNYTRIQEAEKLLGELLGPELAEIIKGISADPGSVHSFIIDLPESTIIDYTIEDLMSLVARTSNMLARVARHAGMARAEAKIAEAAYKRKYKANKVGKNEAEREANAIEATEHESAALNLIEAVVSLVESAEMHGRIASESARKLLDKAATINMAERRESAGSYKLGDFN